MRRAIDHHGVRLIVINPKRIDMCAYAEVWLRPLPGTDVALLNGLMHVLLAEGLQEDAFIEARTPDDLGCHRLRRIMPDELQQVKEGALTEHVQQKDRLKAILLHEEALQ